MFRGVWIGLILMAAAFLCPQPQAKAFDPVTMGALLPMGMNAMSTMTPYVMRGLTNAGGEMLEMGSATLDLMRLPLGAIQSTVLAPWFFGDGIKNMAYGAVAPLKLGFHAVMMPIQMFNVF